MIRPRLPGLRRRRFVLLIGDEGATLVHVVGRQVRRRLFVPVDDPEREARIAEVLAGERNTPVAPLLDLLEQQYREGETPRVGPFDRGKVLRRKLALTFPDAALTGALATGGDERSRSFLFAALPRDDALAPWLAAARRAGNPILPLRLLPVETAGLHARLAERAGPGEAGPGEGGPGEGQWALLMTRQRTGGFRQVITKDGRLVFTRLTPDPGADASAAEVVEAIEREFASTVSYLRRLSYSDAERLALTVLATPEICAAIEPRRLRIRRVTALTPARAADALGLADVAEPEEGYADALYAAVHAQQPRPALAIDQPALAVSRWMNRLPRAATAATAVAAVALIGWSALAWQDLRRERRAVAGLETTVATLEVERDRLAERVAALAEPPERVAATLAGRAALVDATPALAGAVRGVAAALAPPLVVTGLEARVVAEDPGAAVIDPSAIPADLGALAAGAGRPPDGVSPALELVVAVRMDASGRSRADSRAVFDAFERRLSEALPGYRVVRTRSPFAGGGDGGLTGQGGLAARDRAGAPVRLEAEFTLAGPRAPGGSDPA
ncbi:MAG: hypothetical protein RID91_23140 [Azospirillaceae bacterium]